MLASRPIEAQGRFLGVAVTHETRWRFVAIDPLVEDIDGATFPDPAEAKRVAELVLARNGGGSGAAARPAKGWAR